MNYKLIALAAILGLALGVYLTQRFSPPKTVEIEKIVTKTDVVTRVVERPDGSKETTITDHSVKRENSSTVGAAKIPTPGYQISLSAETTRALEAPVYGLQVTKRFIGPFSLGGRVNQTGTFGLVVGMEF